MIKIPVYSKSGSQVGHVEIDPTILGGDVRPALLKQAYVTGHANRRQGSAANRNRSLKEGSTRKLYKQKGTGHARRGAIRTNLMRGGGVTFVKSARTWRQDMPIKMRQLANRNALLSKIIDQEIRIVDSFEFETPKTQAFAQILSALSVNRSCLVALGEGQTNAALSARNIADVDLIRLDQLNAFDLLNHRFLLVEQSSFKAYIDSLKPTTKAGAALAQSQDKEAA